MPSELLLKITPAIAVPFSELRFQVSRSSGPGGQNVNKVNTRVQMWWELGASTVLPADVRARFLAQNATRITREGCLQLECQEHRTQLANRKACLDELAALIRRSLVAPKKRHKTRPTRGSKERRLHAKRERAQQKSSRSYRPGDE